MENLSDWYFALTFFSALLGLTVSAVLFFKRRDAPFPSRLLAGFLASMSFLALNYGLMVTSFFLKFPFLWRALGWASFTFAPFCYLYVRSVLQQSYIFRKIDALFFVPALLFTLNTIPFHFKPHAEQIEFLKQVILKPQLVPYNPEGILPPGWWVWIRVIFGVILVILQVRLLSNWTRKLSASKAPVPQNTSLFRWLGMLTITMMIFWGLIIFHFLFQFVSQRDINQPVIFTIASTIIFVSVSLLARPSILYGMTGWMQLDLPVAILSDSDKAEPSKSVVKKSSLTIAQGQQYKLALESHFMENEPYRKVGYSLGDLASEIGIPSYQLSAFINQEYGMNFNELINNRRVEYLFGLLKDHPENFQFTLEALGKSAGFNSRTSFIAAVKKITGKTPSEYFGKRNDHDLS